MLERLEVCNFKSYKGRQTIGPFKTFSSIIGPNGAGKSNVMDAISFVLGVRSAQLRSTRLQDLIYRAGVKNAAEAEAGAEGDDGEQDAREGGVAAAKSAWVMAVYVDGDGKEWRYQRTVDISGKSQYKVNDKVVGAAHYNDTLESHNILVKAKNFLVFQGDVESVASQSPKQLTQLIEQISGSGELKEQYDAAKLVQDKATEVSTHNFNRRRGFNSEIKQFKEQKSEAEKYESLREQKEEAVVKHLVWKLFHIGKGIDLAKEGIEEKNEGLTGLREENAQYERSLKTARAEVASAQKAVQKQEKSLKKREKDIDEKRPELQTIQDKIEHSNKKIKKAQEKIAEVSKDKETKEGALKSIQDELKKVQRAADRQREEQRQASQAKGLTLNENDVKEYNRLKAESLREAVTERRDLEALDRELKTRRSELESTKDKLEQAQFALEKHRTEQTALSERKAKLDERTSTIQRDLQRAKKEHQDANAERTKANQQVTELNEKLEDCYRKLGQAGADKKESEKEAKLKEVLKSLQRILPQNAVLGRVSDLCKPTQRKYDTAVSVVLGRNIDSVVVDTQKTAIECIEYLRSQRAGVATFLPLDSITPKPVNDKFRSYAHGARLALDVITFDVSVERAMLFACGNTLICDTMEVARHCAYDKGQEVKAVTLDGSMIHKSGLMTGGYDSRGTGRKWDEQEVATLRKQEEHYRGMLAEVMKKKRKPEEDQRLVQEIARLENELTTAKDDLSVTRNRLKDVDEQVKHVSKQVEDLQGKVDQATNELAAKSRDAERLRDTVSASEDTVFETFCRRIGVSDIREYENKQLKEAQAEGETRLRMETQLARLKNQQNLEAERLQEVVNRLKILEQVVSTEQAKLTEFEEQKTAREAELAALSEEIAELRAAFEELQTALQDKTGKLDQVKKESSKSTRAYDQAIKEIGLLNDAMEKLASDRFAIFRKCRLEEIELPLSKGDLRKVPLEDNLRDQMAMDVDQDQEESQQAHEVRDYGIELDTTDVLDDEEKEDESPDKEAALTGSISKLQSEIDRMTPNMKAIDRLDEVSAKLQNTTDEFERARASAKEARDAFNAVKKRRSELFNAAFNHISDSIDKVYKDLTTGKVGGNLGGTAYLALEDGDEPYLKGTKYHAMPPMKRFRDMDQLSGGEKTMAALALLFAIHSFHPSPFFVLDEVDAALDNTNVGWIASYVRSRCSQDFQFIVISLKPSFWERAKGLVGIWRDTEDSSSKVLTLDLEKYDEV